ncbi:MAG TPA: sigma-70 family RNA polymerase sigma factor [Actinomycetota bacterium]|nr:sigma-70 family RNA polymerase sigma factor [Actinomycetota bacterium]
MNEGVRSFEEEWPDLARRLHSMLGAKRIPPWRREDIVQETGLRLFRMWDAVDPERPLWALTVTIALNLVRDEARRQASREILGAVPDIAAPSENVERSGLARVELRAVEKALTQMTPAHRSVLLAEVGDESVSSERGPNAVKMLRMRARRRLTSLLDAASASVGVVGLRLRKLTGIEHHFVPLRNLTSSPFEHAVGPATAGVLAALAFLAIGGPDLGAWLDKIPSDENVAAPKGAVSMSFDAAGSAGTAGDAGLDIVTPNGDDAAAITGSSPYSKENPYRVPVPVVPVAGEDGYIEGEAHLGFLGMGVRFGEHKGRPLCHSAPVVTEARCARRHRARSSSEGTPGGLQAGAKARARFGPLVLIVGYETS